MVLLKVQAQGERLMLADELFMRLEGFDLDDVVGVAEGDALPPAQIRATKDLVRLLQDCVHEVLLLTSQPCRKSAIGGLFGREIAAKLRC